MGICTIIAVELVVADVYIAEGRRAHVNVLILVHCQVAVIATKVGLVVTV
jgi:hypothetical protein